MKILFITSSPIVNEKSVGNTFLNIFSGLEEMELASIYVKPGTPDMRITKALRIDEKMLIKNLIDKNNPVGESVFPDGAPPASPSPVPDAQPTGHTPSGLTHFLLTKRWTVFFWIQNLIWSLGRWKSPQLKQFIKEYKPDVIFVTLAHLPFLNNMILHALNLSGAKLAVYAWDNNYSFKMMSLSPLKWIDRALNRRSMRRVIKKADLFYVISDIQKQDYERYFSKKCTVLTKGGVFEEKPDYTRDSSTPIQLVYTGNIALGRWRSLGKIAAALKAINTDGVKAQLRIYTATPMTKKMTQALDIPDSSFLMGSVPSSEIPGIQQKADILVHVEDFSLKNRLDVRQSFSTKLVDYFAMAKCIFAVGPKDVASIDCLLRNGCAVVACDGGEVAERLHMLVTQPQKIDEYAQKAWQCGKENYEMGAVEARLRRDLNELVN